MLRTYGLLLALMIGLPGANAATFEYEEGTHYVELDLPIKTRNPEQIEVAEYFSYACPHCFQFEPLVNAWKARLDEDVVFRRTPAIWNRDYQFLAQVYFTAQALDVLDVVHGPIFRAIHAERRAINNPEGMAEFFSEYGVSKVDFAKAFSSFGVRAGVQQAEARGRAYRARGVPAIIVNGKYRVEASMAGGNAEMLRVVDFLIRKERAARDAAD